MYLFVHVNVKSCRDVPLRSYSPCKALKLRGSRIKFELNTTNNLKGLINTTDVL